MYRSDKLGNYVFWIRNDFRFHDNTALVEAINNIKEDKKLILIFYLDSKQFKTGHNSHNYFFSALNTFYKTCLNKGLNIYFLYGDIIESFNKLINDFEDIERVYFNIDETGYENLRDEKVSKLLKKRNIEVLKYHDHYIHSGKEILKDDKSHYKVFTPYYNKWKNKFKPTELNIDYEKLKNVTLNDFGEKDAIGKKKFYELINNIKKDFSGETGEKKAKKNLEDFINLKLNKYHENRDYPYIQGTSKISHFLSTGQISIREVYNSISNMPDSLGKETFIKELAWRDFYNMIYYFYPNQNNEEIIEKYRDLEWNYNKSNFEKWKEGFTGFPIVDAGMRQLKKEGWMHNRLRMVVASFLVKDLLIDWRLGEEYFSEMLIDYDSASNIGGWQWAASVGTDAVPYFRVFNPTTQGQKFDLEGKFIKEYVEELSNIPKEYIHEPYKYVKQLNSKYGIDIEKIYNKPIVDHKLQRLKAIKMFKI